MTRASGFTALAVTAFLWVAPAFAGEFIVDMVCNGCPGDTGQFAVTITNNDGFDLTKVTFDLTTATMAGHPGETLIFDQLLSQATPPGGTATFFGAQGDQTFGFTFTGFNTGESFSFVWDSDLEGLATDAVLSDAIGTVVTLDTPAGSVFGSLTGTAEELGVTIQSPTSAAPEPATLTLLGVGAVVLGALGRWRLRK